jgi:hypothetical protein
VFAGVFREEAPAGPLTALTPLAVVAADELAEFLDQWPAALVGGDGALLYAERLPATVMLAVDTATPTAAMVARAWLAGAPGAVEGFAAVLPVYGRAPDALAWQARPAAAPTSGGAS